MSTHALSTDLSNLISEKERHCFTVRDFLNVSGDRAFGVAFLVLSLPSAIPMPAVGISTILGFGIFLLSFQLILGRKVPWLPRKVHSFQFNQESASKFVKSLNWILRLGERLVRPRYDWINHRIGHVLTGSFIAILSVLMILPIPLTNTLPAMMIFFLAVCLTEGDGLMGLIASGCSIIVILLYAFAFWAILFLGFESLEAVLAYAKSIVGGWI